MKKYSYYTPIELARSILALLPDIDVNSIVDICCGSWNLLGAAKEKYKDALITGIDIDQDSLNYRIDGSEFQIRDGREFALSKKSEGKTFDLILSNPPFGCLQEESRKYNDKKFIAEQCYSGLINKRYEGEMTQANMFLAHESSILMFILPNTFVEGATMRTARCQIAKDYSICDIIKLPSNTFEKGEINTFAIIMRKGIFVDKATKLYDARLDDEWRIVKIGEISYGDIVDGRWWKRSGFFKKYMMINIHRGNISSGDFVDRGKKVFHNASKGVGNWKPSIRYYDEKKVKMRIIKANQGDILVNRIGKGAGFWCQNLQKDTAISDCIIAVENTSDDLIKIFWENSTENGRLKIPLRGVATPYITAEDIKCIITGDV